MCLDSHLFNDVDQCMSMHVAATSHLSATNKRKFSRGTPAKQTASYRRLLMPKLGASDVGLVEKYIDKEGALSSSRVVEDVTAIWAPHVIPSENVLLRIREAKGIVIPGLGNRSGRRFVVGGERGGQRAKGPALQQRWFHGDALGSVYHFTELAVAKVENVAFI